MDTYTGLAKVLGAYGSFDVGTPIDVPNLQMSLHVEKYPFGPYGAKGAGELPLVGVPAAYAEAVEQALHNGYHVNHIPFTAEDTMKVLG